MTSEFRKYALKTPYRQAIILNTLCSINKRVIWRYVLNISIYLFFLIVILFYLISWLVPDFGSTSLLLNLNFYKINQISIGLLLISLSLRLVLFSMEAFFKSYYSSIFNGALGNDREIDFKVAEIFYNDRDGTLLKSFFDSIWGKRILKRLDIKRSEINEFLEDKPHKVLPLSSVINEEKKIDLSYLANRLVVFNPSLMEFLSLKEISQQDFKKTAFWVATEHDINYRQQRWWSRENLELIPSLASTWSFGVTSRLDKYAEEIKPTQKEKINRFYPESRRKEVEEIVSLLTRSIESNVVLEGDSDEAKLSIIHQLAGLIRKGQVPNILERRRVIFLKTNLLLASFDNEKNWEKLLIGLFEEAKRAGNIILVIDNLPVFLMAAREKRVNFLELISDYLVSPYLQIIALSGRRKFYENLQGEELISNRFEKVAVSDLDEEETLSLVYEALLNIEEKYSVFFTQMSLVALIESAGKYFASADALQDQVMDLLDELINWPKLKKKDKITKNDIEEFISFKTKIPLGEIQSSEKELLLNLEDKIRQRVIGQDGAVNLAVGALRRARSGISSSGRPLGSFLFLGPTGVGKTETVKALAQEFFGSEERISRLDMSEYQGIDALNKLIGSFESDKPGVLSSLVREINYGILLLDEFEKTTPEVMNLFLQILDEGYFSDMTGQRINARNLIIIATSNAGAELIWQMNKAGRDPSLATSEIIDHLVEKEIYRPELLNRFDAVVVFRPLSPESLKVIAQLEIKKLSKKLSKQGIVLNISQGIVDLVAERGTDRRFGARPLKRFVQEHLENSLAKARIEGSIRPGTKISFDNSGQLKKVDGE